MGLLSNWKNLMTLGHSIRGIRQRLDNAEEKITALEAGLLDVRETANDAQKKSKLLHDALHPFYSQGAEANQALIDKVASL